MLEQILVTPVHQPFGIEVRLRVEPGVLPRDDVGRSCSFACAAFFKVIA